MDGGVLFQGFRGVWFIGWSKGGGRFMGGVA